MESYQQLKDKHKKEFNSYTDIFFAFNTSQFNEGMQKIGLQINETDKILRLGDTGGYILKSTRNVFYSILDKQEQERKEFKKQEKNLLSALVTELINHEYCVTGSVHDALDSLELDINTIDKKLLKKAIKKANALTINEV